MWEYLLNENIYLIAGPSHAEYCKDHSCVKNSLEFSPALYSPFGTKFSYFDSLGTVHASHSGYAYVNKDFPCRVEIHRPGEKGIITTYSHIRVDVKNNQKVEKGDAIGFIETRRMEANCACDPANGKRKQNHDFISSQFAHILIFNALIGHNECAHGPHLRWSARTTKGKPISLDDIDSISGYEIKTGTNPYDEGCEPGNCTTNMTPQQVNSSCSTIFKKVDEDKTYCPSVTGNYGAHIEIFI